MSTPGRPASPASNEYVIPQDAKGVTTATVQVRPLSIWLEIPGKVQADPTRVVRVFAPVVGRLVSLEVRPGDRVGKGQTLAILESSDVAAALADYQKARADAQVKHQAAERASLLLEHQVLAEKEFQQARAEDEMARAELNRARERLRVLNLDPESHSNQFRVVAPRGGVVLEIGAAAGEFSRSLDSSQPLCTLADLTTVWVMGDVYEKDVASVRVGDPADVVVNAYPSEKRAGRVNAISNTVDPSTRTLKVRVVLANAGGRLKPEMFATVRLLRSSRPGIAVPAPAIVREGAAAYLFVERSTGRFERRAVGLGQTLPDGQVEISSGVKAGEVVVTEGALLLRATGP